LQSEVRRPSAARDLQATVDAVRAKYKIPGISVAFHADGRTELAACGVTNVTTGVEMTLETIMHIGSITKLFTASLLMQLVDERKVSLGRPVVEYLPEFRVADAAATRSITVRQLVDHTSGIDGDMIAESGHDDETIAGTVSRFSTSPQLHAPGAARSYCNAGTVVAGYLCQRIAATSWYDLIAERIFRPLGMEHAAVLPEDALLHRPSVGHFRDPSTGAAKRTSHAFLPLGYAPAGATGMMSAADLLNFLRAHLANGVGANGARILSSQSAALMRRSSGDVTGFSCFDGGIGWMLGDGGLVRHSGGGPGIVSSCVAHPDSKTIAVVLTNAEYGAVAVEELIGPFIRSHVGVDPFPSPAPATVVTQTSLDAYVGVYQNSTLTHQVEARDGRLFWSAWAKSQFYDSSSLEKPPPIELIPAADGSFLIGRAGPDQVPVYATSIEFGAPDEGGRPMYLALGARLHRRRGYSLTSKRNAQR
jgi:CubicO group peptidase (beta-lactamase class C family)